MLNRTKLKLALPVLAAVISTTAFAASDVPLYTPDGYAINRNATAAAPKSSSSAGLNKSTTINQNEDRAASKPAQNGDAVRTLAVKDQKTDSTDTCMGSKSTGVQIPIVGGFGYSSSWTDKNCMMIKNARELSNMGYKKAALARMCMDDGNRKALESTGTACPPRKDESSESPPLAYMQ